jgi:hypothetical protein
MLSLLAAGALLELAAGPADASPATWRSSMAAQVEVELDIFSGMPNPTWVLSDAEAASFARRLARLPRASAAEPPGHLGYRGFIVRTTAGARTQEIRIWAGGVHASNGATPHASDADRELEQWLLRSGRPHLNDELLAAVERELHAQPPSPQENPRRPPDVPRQGPTSASPRSSRQGNP